MGLSAFLRQDVYDSSILGCCYITATVQTGDKVNACCVCKRVLRVSVCKRVALLFTACERVCLDVLTRTFVFYHTSKCMLFAGVNLHGLH